MTLFGRVSARWRDLTALALLAAAVGWLFRLHLMGRALFLGKSDRLTNMLNTLGYYAENFQKHRVAAWNECMLTGFNTLALPYTFPTPLAFLESFSRERLFFAAGIGSCALLMLAGWAAYAFIRDVSRHPFAAFVGAVLYQFTALTTLKVSQNDMSFAVLIVIPLMMLLLRRTRPGRAVHCFVGLAMLFGCLLTFMFLQKAAYALMLGGGYALYLTVSRRDWRPMLVSGAALLVGLTAAAPRLYTVGEEMGLTRRGQFTGYESIGHYYEHVAGQTPCFGVFRWLDDGLFYSAGFGRPINLNEGMLLYSSGFTALLLAAGALRFRGVWFRLFRFRDGDLSYLLYFLLLGVAVLVDPLVLYLMYRLFLGWDFTHHRILVACVLPQCTLVAVLLGDFLGDWPASLSARRAGGAFAAAAALALAVVGVRVVLGRAGAATWIDLSRVVEDMQVQVGALLRIAVALAVLVAIGVAARRYGERPALRYSLGVLLGLLLVFDAAAGADLRMNGPQTRSAVRPFGVDSVVQAEPGTFTLPSARARQEFARRLETERYRSIVLVDPRRYPPTCASHLSQFWGLRLADGYNSGIPAALSALPWPAGCCGSRTLTFNASAPLPWHVLSLLNVKYALLVNDAFYFNRVPKPAGGRREPHPAEVPVVTNPFPVAPRCFFAAHAEPASSCAEAAERLFVNDHAFAEIRATSFVEGLPGPHTFPATGTVELRDTGGDRLDITVSPADQPRFLVLNEGYHPRWRAWAGPTELPIYRTNAVMRGVIVPAGVTHVCMRFTPFVLSRQALPFYASAVLLLAAGAWLFRRLERRKGAAAAAVRWPQAA